MAFDATGPVTASPCTIDPIDAVTDKWTPLLFVPGPVRKYRARPPTAFNVFYERLYGAFADYSRSFTRDQVIEIFEGHCAARLLSTLTRR